MFHTFLLGNHKFLPCVSLDFTLLEEGQAGAVGSGQAR